MEIPANLFPNRPEGAWGRKDVLGMLFGDGGVCKGF